MSSLKFIFKCLVLSLFVFKATCEIYLEPCDDKTPIPEKFASEGCTILPCPLVKGTYSNVNITFRIPYDTATSNISVDATIQGITVPFPPPDPSTCHSLLNTYCPLEEDELVTYALKIEVKKIYPEVGMTLRIAFSDENKKEMACFKLPSTYLDKCNISSPVSRLNECVLANGNKGIPHIVKGDPQYNVPNFQPLLVPALTLINDKDLQLIIRTVKIFGSENTKMVAADFHPDARAYKSSYYNPNLMILAQYQINGTLFGRVIYGAGRVKITLVNGKYDLFLLYVTSKADYTFVSDNSLDYTVERVYYEFTNLYDDEDVRGLEMNEMINEHWEDFHMKLKPAASRVFGEIITSAYQSFTDIVHWRDVFYH